MKFLKSTKLIDLKCQMKYRLNYLYLWTLLEGMNIPVLRVDGVEADDIIGTVAKQCSDNGLQCNIVSGDKDFMQLIDDSTFLYAPQARKRKRNI